MIDLAAYTPVDLSRLSTPTVIEPLSYEAIYAAMLANLRSRLTGLDATVESDPAAMLLQVAAWGEFMPRARVNDAARPIMSPYVIGADLDRLAARYGVTRKVLEPGIALTPESDDDFRRRMGLALNTWNSNWPETVKRNRVRQTINTQHAI